MFSIRRSLAWMTLSQGVLFVMQFGVSIVLARLLSPYEFGVFTFAMAIVSLLSILRQVGLTSYLVRAPHLTPALLSSLFTINAAIALFIAAVIAGLSVLGGAALGEPGLRQVLGIMVLLPLIGIFDFIPGSMIERAGNFRATAMINMLRSFVSQVLVVVLAFAGYSYMSLAYGTIVGALIALVCANLVGRAHITLRPGLHDWRHITRFGLHMLAVTGIGVIAARMAELAMARLLGLSALGLYSRATGLYGMLWDNVHLVIARIVFVDLTEKRRQGVSLRGSYLRTMEMTTAVLWPAFAGLAITAGPVITTLYGAQWSEAALPLSLLCLGAIVLVSITLTWEVFVVSEETGRQARLESVRAGAGLLMFVLGCLSGIAAAAAARIGEALLARALYRPHLERLTDTRRADFRPIYGKSLALTLIAVAPAAGVMAAHGFAASTSLLYIAPAALLGVVLWAAALVGLAHPLADEGRRVLAGLRTR